LCSHPGKQSRHPASQRSEKRSVGCSLMPTPPQSQQPTRRVCWTRFPASSRQRQPSFLTPRRQSVGRGLRRDGCMGALGRPARSLPPWCQTEFVLTVSSVVSVRCNVACEMEAVRKWPISRLFLVSCPDEVSRAIAWPRRQAEPRAVMPMPCPCEASRANAGRGRYAEHRGLWSPESLGRARWFLAVSAICGRRNAMERKCSLRN
jgi:hypothetical protein